MLTFNNPTKTFRDLENPRNSYFWKRDRNLLEEPKPIAPIDVNGNLLFLWHIFKLSDCTTIPMDQVALLFGLTHEKATECYVDMKHAIEQAISKGVICDVVKARHDPRHEQPPTSIFTFVDNKIRGRCRKPMSKPNLKKEIEEILRGQCEALAMIRVDSSIAQDPTFMSVMPSTELAQNEQRTSQSDPRRLPSIHELNPFEPQSHVFNLPGKYSIRFGPANVFPVPSANNGQRMVTGEQQGQQEQQQQQSQQPTINRGPQGPGSNNCNKAMPGHYGRTRPVPAPAPGPAIGPNTLRARSLQNTAPLALSASASASAPVSVPAPASASNTLAPGGFNRGLNAGAGLTTAFGQAKTGTATGSTTPAMGQTQSSNTVSSDKDKGKGKRVRTESETESEEDIYS